MKKILAMGLLSILVGTVTIAPSTAQPIDHHHGPHMGHELDRPRGAMMRRGGPGGGMRDVRRQEALVDRLQAQVDQDRRMKRTKTSMYDRHMADLRLAQAQLKAMQVRR